MTTIVAHHPRVLIGHLSNLRAADRHYDQSRDKREDGPDSNLRIVYISSEGLKVFEVTPVGDLVVETVYEFHPDRVVPVLRVFEIIVGPGLLLKIALRTLLGLFFLQVMGTTWSS